MSETAKSARGGNGTTVAIVEDQPRTRQGLAELVAATDGFRVAGAFGTMEEALAALAEAPAEIVLLDIGLPGMSGIDGVRQLAQRDPGAKVLMLTVHADDQHVFAAICAGASGYLLKDTPPERLRQALVELQSGGAPMSPEIARRVLAMFQRVAPPPGAEHGLTARERQVLQLLVDGHSYKTAALELDLALDTLRFHIRHVYQKLHVHSKSEAVMVALRRRIVD
jgi:DNA-binding NarL/FixJ family response regulator